MMGYFTIPILLVLLIFAGWSVAAPAPAPEPSSKCCGLLDVLGLDDLLYSLLTPLSPLVCELLQLINGLTTFILHAILLLLLDYLRGGEISHDTLFNLSPFL